MLSDSGNGEGAIFVGQLYVSDDHQPVKLIFDTGSDYLAMTTSLCSERKLKGTKEGLGMPK